MRHSLDIDPRLPFSGKINIQTEYAMELFEAMRPEGDRPKNQITLDEVAGLQPGVTFEDFLKINKMITFEEVIR